VNILKILFLNFLFFFFLQPIFSVQNMHGFDKPNFKSKFVVGKSKYSNGEIINNCYVYAKNVLIEQNDVGLKGEAKIFIKEYSKLNNINQLCKTNSGLIKHVFQSEGYFDGKINDFLIIKGADSHGAAYKFQIYKILNKDVKLIFEHIRHIDKEFLFLKKSNRIVSLRYWAKLDNEINCSLFNKNTFYECKKKLLKLNNINIETELDFKECQSLFYDRSVDSSFYKFEERDMQFFVKMELPDIQNPNNFKIMDSKLRCEIAP